MSNTRDAYQAEEALSLASVTKNLNAGIASVHAGLNSESESIRMKTRALVAGGMGFVTGMFLKFSSDMDFQSVLLLSTSLALAGAFFPEMQRQAPILLNGAMAYGSQGAAYCRNTIFGKKAVEANVVVTPEVAQAEPVVRTKKAM